MTRCFALNVPYELHVFQRPDMFVDVFYRVKDGLVIDIDVEGFHEDLLLITDPYKLEFLAIATVAKLHRIEQGEKLIKSALKITHSATSHLYASFCTQ